jgi:hypothetical protein
MRPLGLGTKNHCAGEGQQQFSGQCWNDGATNVATTQKDRPLPDAVTVLLAPPYMADKHLQWKLKIVTQPDVS